MKISKKILNVLMVMVLLVPCQNTETENIEKEITRTTDLIENINEYEANNVNEENEENEELVEEPIEDKDVEVDLEDKESSDDPTPSEENTDEDDGKSGRTEKVRIKAVGDIMAHNIQNQYAYNRGGGYYDFSDSFAYMTDFIKDADLSIGNYETTTNPNLAYAGFPRFNTPEAFIKAIADAGFDILTTANNHSLDTELEGLYSTMDAINKQGLDYVGSMKDDSEKILYKDVDGVKIAFLSYTYGANGRENLVVPREEVAELNYLKPKEIERDIKKAKSKGADFVVVYPHWGIEYNTYADPGQIELGRNMIEWGADLVIGNHPHVVQPNEWYEASDGREGFIAYACGNFISYQNLETTNNINTEQAVAYEITLEKNFASGATAISDVKAYPLWVGVTYNDYGPSIQTRLTTDFLDGGKYYNELDDYQRNRTQQAYDTTTEILNQGVN